MLATVHAYLNLKKNETGLTLGKMEAAISLKYPELSMSDTKLSKIFKDPKSKISMEELFAIVDSMGLDKTEILAILGEQEYRASQGVDYMGATELIADFQRREEAIRKDHAIQLAKAAEIREGLQNAFEKAERSFTLAVETIARHRDEELKKRDEIQVRVVSHLEQELIEKEEACTQLKERLASDAKSLKWWRAAAVFGYSILSSAFIYILWELINLDKGATAVLIQMVRDGVI